MRDAVERVAPPRTQSSVSPTPGCELKMHPVAHTTTSAGDATKWTARLWALRSLATNAATSPPAYRLSFARTLSGAAARA
jgi:hypothetical protein